MTRNQHVASLPVTAKLYRVLSRELCLTVPVFLTEDRG